MSDSEYEGDDGGRKVYTKSIGEYYGARDKKNNRHGQGRTVFPNGDIFLGCYCRGVRHGLGVYTYKKGKGARYAGDWTSGARQGWGTFYFPDGSVYTGTWENGKRHGWGVYVYTNGDEYKGWWYRGFRNGSGIYRTKKTGDKFIGEWVLGQRQGSGMLIRKHHRYIGKWYNDMPKGEGIYILQHLGIEQHGRYTHMKIQPGNEEKWRKLGYSVRMIRSAPPPKTPMEVELQWLQSREELNEEPDTLAEDENNVETQGEGGNQQLQPEGGNRIVRSEGVPLKSGRETAAEQKSGLKSYLTSYIEKETTQDNELVPVVLVWRYTKITELITPIPVEDVPPPIMPPIPVPPPDLEMLKSDVEEEEEVVAETIVKKVEDAPAAKVLAQTHALGPTFYGHFSLHCEPSQINLPGYGDEMLKLSEMSFSGIDELRAAIFAREGQLGPLDMKALMEANEHLFQGRGMETADKWRECLAEDENCNPLEVPLPPPGRMDLKKKSLAEETEN